MARNTPKPDGLSDYGVKGGGRLLALMYPRHAGLPCSYNGIQSLGALSRRVHEGFDKRFWNCFIALIVAIRASGFNYLQIVVLLQRCPNCGEGGHERRELTDVTPRRLASGWANSIRNYSIPERKRVYRD